SRLRRLGDDVVVDVAVRVDAQNVAGPEMDVAHVQVAVVSPRTGAFVVGPQQDLTVTGSGLTTIVELTNEQVTLLNVWRSTLGWEAAARTVTVGIRHEADVDAEHPGIDAQAIDARIARWGGQAPVPPVVETRGTGRDVTYVNATPNPLVLLGGPVNCMYDANYPLETGSNQKSDFLAQVNGAVLPPGVSLTTASSNSGNTGDTKFATTSAAVFAAYSAAMTSTYQWFSGTSARTSLPKLPSKASLPPGVTGTQAQLIQSLIVQVTQDALSAGGTFGYIYDSASLAAGAGIAWAGATGAFDLPGIDQVLAIIGVLIDDLLSSCSDVQGAFLAGATDATHPWRQFTGLYAWNGGAPYLLASSKKVQYRPYANGMIVSVFASPQSSDLSSATADQLDLNVMPGSAKQLPAITFTFTEPDYNADYPADISISGRTVSCALDGRDVPGQSQAMNAITSNGTVWFLTAFPTAVWQKLNNATIGTQTMPTSPVGANAYADGMGYAAPGTPGIVTVYTSPDGQSWSAPLAAAANSTSVTIPASTTARLIQCTVQSVESWRNPVTINGRRVIMGTRVMSDMVLGPDAKS
ncbi:MAG: hypothetical protein WCI74_17205, partial [Actinomycetes bacterium]